MDNEKLEKHISEWKLIAEESKSNADKYCREMNKIFIALEDVDYWYRHHGSTIRGHYIGYDMGYDASYVYDRDCLFVSYRIGNMTRHLMGSCITSPVAIYLLYIAR